MKKPPAGRRRTSSTSTTRSSSRLGNGHKKRKYNVIESSDSEPELDEEESIDAEDLKRQHLEKLQAKKKRFDDRQRAKGDVALMPPPRTGRATSDESSDEDLISTDNGGELTGDLDNEISDHDDDGLITRKKRSEFPELLSQSPLKPRANAATSKPVTTEKGPRGPSGAPSKVNLTPLQLTSTPIRVDNATNSMNLSPIATNTNQSAVGRKLILTVKRPDPPLVIRSPAKESAEGETDRAASPLQQEVIPPTTPQKRNTTSSGSRRSTATSQGTSKENVEREPVPNDDRAVPGQDGVSTPQKRATTSAGPRRSLVSSRGTSKSNAEGENVTNRDQAESPPPQVVMHTPPQKRATTSLGSRRSTATSQGTSKQNVESETVPNHDRAVSPPEEEVIPSPPQKRAATSSGSRRSTATSQRTSKQNVERETVSNRDPAESPSPPHQVLIHTPPQKRAPTSTGSRRSTASFRGTSKGNAEEATVPNKIIRTASPLPENVMLPPDLTARSSAVQRPSKSARRPTEGTANEASVTRTASPFPQDLMPPPRATRTSSLRPGKGNTERASASKDLEFESSNPENGTAQEAASRQVESSPSPSPERRVAPKNARAASRQVESSSPPSPKKRTVAKNTRAATRQVEKPPSPIPKKRTAAKNTRAATRQVENSPSPIPEDGTVNSGASAQVEHSTSRSPTKGTVRKNIRAASRQVESSPSPSPEIGTLAKNTRAATRQVVNPPSPIPEDGTVNTRASAQVEHSTARSPAKGSAPKNIRAASQSRQVETSSSPSPERRSAPKNTQASAPSEAGSLPSPIPDMGNVEVDEESESVQNVNAGVVQGPSSQSQDVLPSSQVSMARSTISQRSRVSGNRRRSVFDKARGTSRPTVHQSSSQRGNERNGGDKQRYVGKHPFGNYHMLNQQQMERILRKAQPNHGLNAHQLEQLTLKVNHALEDFFIDLCQSTNLPYGVFSFQELFQALKKAQLVPNGSVPEDLLRMMKAIFPKEDFARTEGILYPSRYEKTFDTKNYFMK